MSEPSTETPKRLADFEIIRRLGAGGMAEVFLAKKRGAERTYKLLVVKRILPKHLSSRRFRTMFAEEAQLATRLNHPNIVQVYDFQDAVEDGQLLSMEYVEGPDLRKLERAARAKGQRIPPYVAAYIAAEVASGLHYAHERKDERGKPLQIVHRDVSPQNVLLSFDGAVKIADFGIATANLFREEHGILKGKTGYMSPEQARGEKVDRRTDVYSLGVVLHEMLSGKPLHGSSEGADPLDAARSNHVEPPSTFATGVPPELDAIVMRALSKDPDERFATARDFAAAITRVLLQKQELVDAHAVETVLAELVGRDTLPLDLNVEADESTSDASKGDYAEVASDGGPLSRPPSEAPGHAELLRERVGREVRHVAIVTLRVHHTSELYEALDAARVRRLLEQLRATLSEIAFKRGANWIWEERQGDAQARPLSARAIVGLMDNPARAALDAAFLAVDLHEAIHGACDGLPVTLAASVGIVRGIASGRCDAAGHLLRHTLHKPADELADLVGERAPAGQTWVLGGLYRLVRRDFVWRDAPAIEIQDADHRNLPRKLRVHVLERPLTRGEKLAQRTHTRDLIGRDAELQRLRAAYHKAASVPYGEGRVACRVVIGEMGIGKTALVEAFISELPESTRVTQVESPPACRELPYSLIGRWLQELTGISPETELHDARSTLLLALGLSERRLGGHTEEIVKRMTELSIGRVAEAFDEADVDHYRRIVTSGVRRLLGRTAAQRPLVVLIDSIHWADLPSLELIALLAKRPTAAPILVVLVARPDERIVPQIRDLERIELRGLSAEDQIRLVQSHLGVVRGVPSATLDLIQRAAGNPFFLLEMVDASLERGALELGEDSKGEQALLSVERPGTGNGAVPWTLEQLIADRLNELAAPERTIIDWLAVSGGPLRISDLEALAPLEATEPVTHLGARGVVEARGDAVDVRHPLTRDVAYSALDRSDRVRMHLSLGEHLAKTSMGLGLNAAIVARHFARGENTDLAAKYYLRAALAARRIYQLKLAARYFRRVLSLVSENDSRRIDALDALENMYRIQGRRRERRRCLTALRKLARATKKPYGVATALIRSARFDLDDRRLAQGLNLAELGEHAARLAKSPALEVEAQRLMAEVLRELGDMQGALAACDRALLTASKYDTPQRLKAQVLRARGTLLLRVGRVSEAIDAHVEAIAVFRRGKARRLEARAKTSLGSAVFVLGQFNDAIALGLEAIRIDLAIGGRFQIARTLSIIGQSYARLGDLTRAEQYLSRSREAHQRYGDQNGRIDTLLASAEILIEKKQLDAAEQLIVEATAIGKVTGSSYDAVHEKILRALLARARGQANGAVMYAFDARQVAEAQAYVAFHLYAMAIEALSRVEVGEEYTGVLLATTALGAIETLEGSEFGLETRAFATEALIKAGSPQAAKLGVHAQRYAQSILGKIRDPDLAHTFKARPVAKMLLDLPTPLPRADDSSV